MDRDKKERVKEYQKRYVLKNKEKVAARTAIFVSARGGVINKPTECELCRGHKKLSAHHWHGYDKLYKLDVLWLCNECHPLMEKYVDTSVSHNDGTFDIAGNCDVCLNQTTLTSYHWHGFERKEDVLLLCKKCFGIAEQQLIYEHNKKIFN